MRYLWSELLEQGLVEECRTRSNADAVSLSSKEILIAEIHPAFSAIIEVT